MRFLIGGDKNWKNSNICPTNSQKLYKINSPFPQTLQKFPVHVKYSYHHCYMS